MDKVLIHVALSALVIIIIYGTLARGLLKVTEPLRQRCLDHYAKVVKSGRASKELVARLETQLDSIYSSWSAWQMAVMAIFVVFVVLPIRKLRHAFSGEKDRSYLDDIPDSIRSDVDRFDSCWMLATVANSPIAAAIFVFASLIGVAVLGSLMALTKVISSSAPRLHHRHAH